MLVVTWFFYSKQTKKQNFYFEKYLLVLLQTQDSSTIYFWLFYGKPGKQGLV
jgi:hypothetical protein